MSVTVQEILQELKAFAPLELACSWDNVGLLVDAGRPVEKYLQRWISPPTWCGKLLPQAASSSSAIIR